MYIICIESSKTRGMGHLFRSLLYAEYLKNNNTEFTVLINNDEKSTDILNEKKIPYEIVDYYCDSDWETDIIKKYNADVWLEDKFETSDIMAENIKKNNILFCTIDDFSSGSSYADISFAGMLFLTGNTVRGKKQYTGSKYVILNSEIDNFRRKRKKLEKIIVSLGGSDPFGVTVEAVKELNKTNYNAEIIIGPDFDYINELNAVNEKGFTIKQYVPSLIEEFSGFDFAITGGGVTCCEACAAGIPCMIIANAPHEIFTGNYMQKTGSSIFAGSYENWNRKLIHDIEFLNIEKMSKKGMDLFDTRAVERIFSVIEKEMRKV